MLIKYVFILNTNTKQEHALATHTGQWRTAQYQNASTIVLVEDFVTHQQTHHSVQTVRRDGWALIVVSHVMVHNRLWIVVN
jgi:hypothetical protein